MCLNVLWSDSKTPLPTQLQGNSQATALSHTHTHQAAMRVSLMWVLKDSLSLSHTPHTHEHQCLSFWPECSRKTLAKSDGRQVVASSGRTTASISLRTSQWRETSTCIAAERMSEFLSWMPAHRSSSSTWQIRQTDNWFLTPCQQWLRKSTETDFIRTQYMLKNISTYHTTSTLSTKTTGKMWVQKSYSSLALTMCWFPCHGQKHVETEILILACHQWLN